MSDLVLVNKSSGDGGPAEHADGDGIGRSLGGNNNGLVDLRTGDGPDSTWYSSWHAPAVA